MGIKDLSSFSLSFLSLFHTVPKKAEYAVLQAEYTLDFLAWCIDPFYFLLKKAWGKEPIPCTTPLPIYPQVWWDPGPSHKNKADFP